MFSPQLDRPAAVVDGVEADADSVDGSSGGGAAASPDALGAFFSHMRMRGLVGFGWEERGSRVDSDSILMHKYLVTRNSKDLVKKCMLL